MKTMIMMLVMVMMMMTLGMSSNVHEKSLFVVSSPDPSLVSVFSENFDIWGVIKDEFHVYAPTLEFETLMAGKETQFKRMEHDLDLSILEERRRIENSRGKVGWFEEYHDYNETKGWFQDLSKEYSNIATFVPSIGRTWEGRDIFAFRITASRDPKRIWIQCNIHAREWISLATCGYFVNEVLTSYNSDPVVTELLQKVEFVMIPIVNPDGYAHTWTVDRMWRKNRRNNGSSYGVDLNRNFDQQWGGVGSSPTPSSDTYRGPSPASEPETRALSSFFNSFPKFSAALDIHSYSQYILRPFTHISSPPPNDASLEKVSKEMADIIYSVDQKRYTPGIWYSLLYPSSGVAQDYYYVQGGAFSFTIELRPTTPFPGFVLPPDQIIPTGREITPALLHLAAFAASNN